MLCAQSEVPEVSLIIPVKNEGSNVTETLESAMRVKTDRSFEMIIVDDGSTDGCCDGLSALYRQDAVRFFRTEGIGVSMVRNRGADQARGRYLIFCDAHLGFEDYWMDRMLHVIESDAADAVSPGIARYDNPDVVGYGLTLNEKFEARWLGKPSSVCHTAILPGGCLAVSKSVFDAVGGFDNGFRVWGYEDIELTMKLWLFGYTCSIEPLSKVRHKFRKKHPYPVTYKHLYYNMLRLAYSHFNEERIEQCKGLVIHADASQIESEVLSEGVMEQRKTYLAIRKHSDDWYMEKFGIPFGSRGKSFIRRGSS